MDFRDIIRNKPYLIWYTKDYDALNEEAVVEAVLNYGNWDDFLQLKEVLGLKNVAEIFHSHASRPRTNYREEVRQYFDLYFAKHA